MLCLGSVIAFRGVSPPLKLTRHVRNCSNSARPKAASKRKQGVSAAPVVQPGGESRLHFMTKSHLAQQLAQTSTLSVQQFCSTRANPDAPAVYPYWSCTNSKIHKDWLQGWNATEMEHTLRGVGKFDVALLRKTPNGPSALVGAVEVLVSSPMTESKLTQLKNRNVPWVEVQAHVDFFRTHKSNSEHKKGFHGHRHAANAPFMLQPKAWSHDKPLKVVGTSDGPWTCPVCEEMSKLKPETLIFSHIASIVDVYLSATTNHGRGQVKRKVFGIFKQTRPKEWSKPDLEERTHFFLVVGTSLSTTTPLGLNTLPIDSKLIYSTHKIDHSKTWESPPLAEFKRQFDFNLSLELSKDAGAILDHRLEWPGATVNDFFKQVDPMSQLVSIQGIRSIGKLQASLSRLVGYRYRFDIEEQSWVPNKNHKLKAL